MVSFWQHRLADAFHPHHLLIKLKSIERERAPAQYFPTIRVVVVVVKGQGGILPIEL